MTSFLLPKDIPADPFALHVCCAPCSGGIIRSLLEEGKKPTLFFYNPNIHPYEEYCRRKDEVVRFAQKNNLPFSDGDYDVLKWSRQTKHLWHLPERGARCQICFDIRLLITAQFAKQQNLKAFATTLGISRFKNLEQLHIAGLSAQEKTPQTLFLSVNWRKKGGMEKMTQTAQEENFYRQDYCGCFPSKQERQRQQLKKEDPSLHKRELL